MATILLIIIYLAFISLGLPDSMLGAAWPVAYAQLGAPVSYAGFVSIGITIGTVVSSLVSVRVIRRFGTGGVTAACVLLTGSALLAISFTQSFVVLLLLAVPLGLGGGAIDAALNNYVALHYKASHMSFLHSFWGVGATISPLIMSQFLRQSGNWQGGYRFVSIIQLSLALIMFLTLPLWGKVPHAARDELIGEPIEIDNRTAIKKRGVIFAVLAFFFYCAGEAAVGLWAATYFVTVRAVAPSTAASWGSLFFFGIMGGRMISGLLAMRVKERVLINTGLSIAVFGALLLALPLPQIFSLTGLLLFGLGCAPVFPNLIHITPQRFGKNYSQAIIGLLMAAAYLGATLMPPLVGWVGQTFGFTWLPYYLLACLAGLYATIVICNKKTGFGVSKTESV
ncbi:MAG TPA: MFS transporter [Clostridiales bacterium]|nr:MFS transporter [Clostridiales bacterium]